MSRRRYPRTTPTHHRSGGNFSARSKLIDVFFTVNQKDPTKYVFGRNFLASKYDTTGSPLRSLRRSYNHFPPAQPMSFDYLRGSARHLVRSQAQMFLHRPALERKAQKTTTTYITNSDVFSHQTPLLARPIVKITANRSTTQATSRTPNESSAQLLQNVVNKALVYTI